MVSQVQMWARSSDPARSEPSSNCPSFLLEKKRHFLYLNGVAKGLWEALQPTYRGRRPGVAWCQDGALLEIISPILPSKAQKRTVTYEGRSKEPEPSLLAHSLVLPLFLPPSLPNLLLHAVLPFIHQRQSGQDRDLHGRVDGHILLGL